MDKGDEMMPTGYTYSEPKYCIRCHRLHEDTLYQLCQVCRDGDELAQWFVERDNDAADEHDRQSEAHLERYGY